MEEKDYPYMFFSQVNRGVEPYLMKDDELWDSVNYWTERKLGAKKVRPGLTAFLNNPDSDPVKALFYVKFPNGQKRLARISGNKIYAVDPNSAPNWGSAKATITPDFVRPDYTVLAGKAHIVDQISLTDSKYFEWTNSSGTDTIAEPTYASGTDTVIPYKAKSIVTFHRRIYTGSPFESPDTLRSQLDWSSIDYVSYGSNPLSPWTTLDETPESANYTPVDTDYKGGISKLTNINDRINIYKEEGVYRFNESQLFSLFGVAPIEGSIATMPETQEDYFLTNEGFFKTNGKDISPISDGWYPIIKEIFDNGITPSKINCWSINFLYFCYLGDISYDGVTITNAMFVYSAKYQELSLWSMAYDISAIGHYVDDSNNNIVVMGDSSGNVYKLDYDADDDAGEPILAYFKTKYYFFDSIKNRNQLSEIHSFATLGGEQTIQIDKDYHNEYKDISQIVDTHNLDHLDLSKAGQFYTLSFKVTWNGKGKRPEFYGLLAGILQRSEGESERRNAR